MNNRLREKRVVSGMTQAQLAEMVSVSRQTIISIESGKYVPSVELALRLARSLACQVEDLFFLSGE